MEGIRRTHFELLDLVRVAAALASLGVDSVMWAGGRSGEAARKEALARTLARRLRTERRRRHEAHSA